jgi:hypothetical protein
MAAEAVLCIECGFDRKLGQQLATVVDRATPRPRDDNPYAAPAPLEWDESPRVREDAVFDLTEHGAERAKAIASDAEMAIYLVLLAWCLCAPLWLVILPWYSLRLLAWHSLNRSYAELRNPNGFSPYAETAVRFQDARRKLWLAVIAGAVFWILALVGLAIEFARHSRV